MQFPSFATFFPCPPAPRPILPLVFSLFFFLLGSNSSLSAQTRFTLFSSILGLRTFIPPIHFLPLGSGIFLFFTLARCWLDTTLYYPLPPLHPLINTVT
jgi:hypothetical protein